VIVDGLREHAETQGAALDTWLAGRS